MQRFYGWIFPHLQLGEELAEEYFEAKVKKEQSEANILKLKEVGEFNNIINDIFSNDDLPQVVKALKLAKIIESNPDVIVHLESAKKIINELQLS